MNLSNRSLTSFMDSVSQIAEKEGLHFFGIAGLDVSQDYQWYRDWLQDNRHGSMEWMTNHLDIRENPEKLLPGAKTAFIFGFPYYLGDKWLLGHKNESPQIGQYARLRDYHKFLRAKLERVQSDLKNQSDGNHVWRITVDSAPLLERALAANSGGGFIGKNTCVIHPQKGSFFLLGEILSSLEFNLPPRPQVTTRHQKRSSDGGCGSCRRCQVHCPTGALDQDYRIDARKCLSYWTIEHRGEIPLDFWPWIGRYMFGCDICQLVCPYNRNIDISDEAKSLEKIAANIPLFDIVTMNQDYYEQVFGGTPMTRAKHTGLRRNALIAGVVTGDQRVTGLLSLLEADGDRVIRETARQAQIFLTKTKKDQDNT